MNFESLPIDIYYHISRFFTSRNHYIQMTRVCRHLHYIFKSLLYDKLIPKYLEPDNDDEMWMDIYAEDIQETYIINHPGRYRLKESIVNRSIDKPLFIIRYTYDVKFNFNNQYVLPKISDSKQENPLMIVHDCQRITLENFILINNRAPHVEVRSTDQTHLKNGKCFILQEIPSVNLNDLQ